MLIQLVKNKTENSFIMTIDCLHRRWYNIIEITMPEKGLKFMPEAGADTITSGSYSDEIYSYIKVLKHMSCNTDDILYLADLQNDANWFIGDVENKYKLRDCGREYNTLAEVLENVYPPDRNEIKDDIMRMVRGEKTVHDMEYRWMTRDGEPVWVSCRGNIVKDADGNSRYMIGRVSEVAMRHFYNPVTGLANKDKMMNDLKQTFSDMRGYLMLLDVDELPVINLKYGIDYGDHILKKLAYLLEGSQDFTKVYHTDHNYFALFCDAGSEAKVRELFAKICDVMSCVCDITAGVVPVDKNVFIDENNMYDSAKLILRKSRSIGKNNILFFTEDEIRSRLESMELLDEIYESVNNGCSDFCLEFQPQINAGSYVLYSAETLLRYNSAKRGKVFPDEFIPLLEKSGLIVQVGNWVLEQALLQCKKWRSYVPDMRVSVNFSVVQLEHPGVVKDVMSILDRTGMGGDALTIEITESIHLHNINHISSIISQLKDAGIQIAVDDFGTGYSNIGYLKELDVDEIKIDRMFVADIRENTYNYNIISNTIEFAKASGIRVCCEGVEESCEVMILESMSPDLFQGYFFDRPSSAEYITSRYMDSSSELCKSRESFVKELYVYKEKTGFVHFDPIDILRETNVGLWVIRINPDDNIYEMHADETMERIMGVDKKYTPAECYEFWHSRISKDYLEYVHNNVEVMTGANKVIQIEYPWIHPEFGQIMVSCTGKRTKDCDGMVVIEGYHRNMEFIEEV